MSSKFRNFEEYIDSIMQTDVDFCEEKVTASFANTRANMAGKVISFYKCKIEYDKSHKKAATLPFMELTDKATK